MKDEVKLKILKPNVLTKNVLDWYKDKDVIKFSDNQYRKITMKSQTKYINECLKSDIKFLYGIFYNDYYIGNIIITNIYYYHKTGEISFFIGEKLFWGKGIMTEAISKIIEIAKNELNLKKLCAGVVSDNIASIKTFEKNGFIKEGVRKNHLIYDEKVYDQFDYALFL